MRKRGLGAVIAVVALSLAAPMSAAAQTPAASQAVEGVPAQAAKTTPQQPPVTELIVKYKPGVAPTEAPGVATGDRSVDGVELEPGRKMSLGLRTVELSESLDVDEAKSVARELAADPRVESAMPNLRVFPTRDVTPSSATSPNDPAYTDNNMWGLNGAYGIDGPRAWGVTTGATDVVVAVLDTGITTHSELPDSVKVAGYDMISNIYVANDLTARDGDPSDPGDWVTAAESSSGPYVGCPTTPSSWHGTHVTGTINALSDNGAGVASVAPGVKVQPVRVLGKCGGVFSDVIDGITWASGGDVPLAGVNARPADVINLSLGGPGSCDVLFQRAIDAAVGRGTTVIASAGNSEVDVSGASPASCNNVIAVGAVGSDGKRASFSNYGSAVDVAAPGFDIWSTSNTGNERPVAQGYEILSGTSMAAPHVAGLAALVKSQFPELTPAQIESRLTTYTKPFAGGVCDPNSVKTCGSGIANAGSVTTGLVSGVPQAPVTPPASAPPPVAAPQVIAPGAVSSLKAKYSKAKAKLSWSIPASNGGAAVSHYTYRVSKNGGKTWGAWRSTTSNNVTVVRSKKLKYAIQVAAVNPAGGGPVVQFKIKRR